MNLTSVDMGINWRLLTTLKWAQMLLTSLSIHTRYVTGFVVSVNLISRSVTGSDTSIIIINLIFAGMGIIWGGSL